MSKRRIGKIARLPKDARDRVNEMLRDGQPYEAIKKFCQKHECHVNDQNISNWREGGHQDWLKEQERLEDMRLKREFALDVVRQSEGSQIHVASLQIAASQIYEVLNDFDATTLTELLRTNPENYAKLVNALSRLSKSGLEYDKYRRAVQEARDAIQSKLEKAKEAGLSPETIDFIEQKLGLM